MSTDEIREIKAFVKAVVGGHVVADNMGYCAGCLEYKDLRMGLCFTCAFDECPLESCNSMRMVFNAKRERVLKDSTYTTGGVKYCNHEDGLCKEAISRNCADLRRDKE